MLFKTAFALLIVWLLGMLGVYRAGDLTHVLLLVGLMLLLLAAGQWVPSGENLGRHMVPQRRTGSVAPEPKRGGCQSPIDFTVLEAVIADAPDGTIAELCWEYNRRVPRERTTTATSFGRTMRRAGYVPRKRRGPSECDRQDVAPKRGAFLRWMRRVDPRRLIFSMNPARTWRWAGRTCGSNAEKEYVAPRPMTGATT